MPEVSKVELREHHKNVENKLTPAVQDYKYFVLQREDAFNLDPIGLMSMSFSFVTSHFKNNEELNYFVRSNVKSHVPVYGIEGEYCWCSGFGETLEEAIEYVEAFIRESREVVEPLKGTVTTELIHNDSCVRLTVIG